MVWSISSVRLHFPGANRKRSQGAINRDFSYTCPDTIPSFSKIKFISTPGNAYGVPVPGSPAHRDDCVCRRTVDRVLLLHLRSLGFDRAVSNLDWSHQLESILS